MSVRCTPQHSSLKYCPAQASISLYGSLRLPLLQGRVRKILNCCAQCGPLGSTLQLLKVSGTLTSSSSVIIALTGVVPSTNTVCPIWNEVPLYTLGNICAASPNTFFRFYRVNVASPHPLSVVLRRFMSQNPSDFAGILDDILCLKHHLWRAAGMKFVTVATIVLWIPDDHQSQNPSVIDIIWSHSNAGYIHWLKSCFCPIVMVH